MGSDKTYDSIKQKYYWPNLYKQLYEYIASCVTCQTRSMRKIKQPLQETDIPPYAFAKLGLDLSGPYPTSLSGNKYIVGFIDWYSGYPEAFAVPDKTADTIAHLIIEEIFPRYGAPLEIVTDNSSENVNRVVRETLQALNVHHVTTSVYHPQANSKIERFHRTLHDVLSKTLKDNVNTWDLYLNQTLAAIRFNISESSKFSPFFLLYNRDVVLPLDNILKPRRKYTGEDTHQIALEQQHKSFLLVHINLKRAKRRQARYADTKAKKVQFEIGDPVYYKVHNKKSKLNLNWKPYYRVIAKLSDVNYKIKHQLDGSIVTVHAENIRKAHVDDWQIPNISEGRPLRKTNYVVPPESNKSSTSSDSTDEDVPLARLANRYRQERDNSDSEGHIPKMELAKYLRRRDNDDEINSDTESTSSVFSRSSDNRENSDAPESMDDENCNEHGSLSGYSETNMSVNEACVVPYKGTQIKRENKSREATCNLLTAIVGLLKASDKLE